MTSLFMYRGTPVQIPRVPVRRFTVTAAILIAIGGIAVGVLATKIGGLL